ncbi:FAD-dependent oxidoreductase [Enterobacillus tribolii]|uniref:Protein FixC n=1 Tax=Enterobacillus tribolii TaxID=1487935 RepID=A0A370QM56_9GAMM|nr:FAD-dependent oxidoreductase [Enterobacillus tribolii]MBW7982284.1 FAD-dependent oxidoreductase [Enterobacillus tribolii]RDK89454.1 flavin-dependent dehydrogenase [Enterobacillus tribolii]
MEDDFDVIVVGGGFAGCASALLLARAGLNVALLERAATPGGKSLSGGRLYAHALEAILPGFSEHAPLERKITREKLTLMNADSAATLDYHHAPGPDGTSSYSVLRSRFDPWLMAQAEHAGAQCLCGIRVDELVTEQGCVRGIRTGDDILRARVVILAEGANTLLGEKHGLIAKPAPRTMAIGVKEVISLPRQCIEDRFGLEENQGAAWLFAGDASAGEVGGGFLYTNRDTLSLGVVCNLAAFNANARNLPAMLENFKRHPAVRPLLRGGELLEYGARLIPEGGLDSMPAPSGAGYLIVGDAARLCVNAGHTVRGMDLAVLSAQAAAQAVMDALSNDDVSAAGLRGYTDLLHQGALGAVLRQYRRLPETLLASPHFFRRYPQLTNDLLRDLFRVNGDAPQPLRRILWRHARQAGWRNLFNDVIRGLRSL